MELHILFNLPEKQGISQIKYSLDHGIRPVEKKLV